MCLFHNGQVGNDSDFDSHFVTSKDHVGHFKAGNTVDAHIDGFASRKQILLQLPVVIYSVKKIENIMLLLLRNFIGYLT